MHTHVRLPLTAVMNRLMYTCLHVWKEGLSVDLVCEVPRRFRPTFGHVHDLLCAQYSMCCRVNDHIFEIENWGGGNKEKKYDKITVKNE